LGGLLFHRRKAPLTRRFVVYYCSAVYNNHGDRDPSLRHDKKKDRVFCASQNCFGSTGADAFGLVQVMESCNFKEALQKLADRYGSFSPIDNFVSGGKQSTVLTAQTDSVLANQCRDQLRQRGFDIVAEYYYTPELRKVRFENPSKSQVRAKSRKTFRWEHCIQGVWYSGDGGIEKTLYLNSVFRDRDQVGLAVGFEGEAKADAAATFGFASFSFKDITPDQAIALSDCEVVLWPDKDTSGAKQVNAAAHAIRTSGKARTIRLISPPEELPDGGDIIDAIKTLGWDAPRLKQLVEAAVPFAEDVEESALDPTDGSLATRRFRVSDKGVFFLKDRGDGTPQSIRLSARLNVLAETRDSDGNNWGRLLTWRDNEGRVHQWAMPMELLSSDASAVRSRLLGEGLPFITTNCRLRERFTEYLQTTSVEKRIVSVSRIGWHRNAYVLPDQAFGLEDGDEIMYQTTAETEHHWRTHGSPAGWRDEVGRRCKGNSRLIIAASCGFAGPLISIAGAESGGVHFHGSTSIGKSTALIVGGSVCGGGGQGGFVGNWRNTINGIEAVAAAHNDATLFLDELAQVDAREASDIAYLLANGQGKGRMTRTISARKKLTWVLLFVSAGELTLAEHAASAGKRTKGGAEVRLLNIRADAGKGLGMFETLHGADSPQRFVSELRNAVQREYGTPFRAFVSRLVKERVEAQVALSAARTAIKAVLPVSASGEINRVAERFALIAAAGELASQWDLTGWNQGEPTKSAIRCFSEWLEDRGTFGGSDLESGIRQVRAFIGAHGASRFQSIPGRRSASIEEEQGPIIRDRAGFRRVNSTGETEYLIFPETFRAEVCAGYDYRAICHELNKRKFLTRDEAGLMIKPRLPELGPTWVYCVRARILEHD
jgi:uncharacterized protein (DUF927 family)